MLKELLVAVGLLTPAQIPSAQIIGAMDPWTLACAVGAENGSIGAGIGFDMWLRLSKKNWMPTVVTRSQASEQQIEKALRAFVNANAGRDYKSILREQETSRGLAASPVLGPGETMTITVPLEISQ